MHLGETNSTADHASPLNVANNCKLTFICHKRTYTWLESEPVGDQKCKSGKDKL